VLLAELLAHELVVPVVARGTAFLGHETGDYERHFVGECGCEGAFGKVWERFDDGCFDSGVVVAVWREDVQYLCSLYTPGKVP
jgi:hypothetical protein